MDKNFSKIIRVGIVLLYTIIITGCMSPMALSSRNSFSKLNERPIAILSIKTSNDFKPKYQPIIDTLTIVREGKKKNEFFKVEPFNVTEEFVEHLVSLDVKPGNYMIRSILGKSKKFPIKGCFYYDLNARFELEPGTISYLGHIEMNNREKQKGEKASGLPVPLIDNAVSGFSNGTFDVQIYDAYDRDIARFINQYPGLEPYIIQKSILDH